jgi:hypothetical protein
LTTPYPSDMTTRRLGDAPQPSTGAAATGAAPRQPPREAPQRIPGLRRRLALLAATLYMPVILLGYALYLHGPTDCVSGPLCSLGDAPALAQALFIALGFGLLYLIGVRPLAALLDERQPARSEVARTLQLAARYETIRPLLAIFGSLITLALLVGFVARTLNLPAFVIGAGIAALLFTLAALGEP